MNGKSHWRNRMAMTAVVLHAVLFAALPARASELSPEQQALHVLNRLGYGPKSGDIERVKQIGIARYIDIQLHPETIELSGSLTSRLAALDVADENAGEVLAQFLEARKAAKEDDAAKQRQREIVARIAQQTAQARIMRAIDSPRQLEEVMVDFWFNHFNVFAGKGLDRALVASYERDAIRPYVLGSFRELLGATAKHPAMLFYLDNWLSTSADYQPGKDRKSIGQGAKAKAGGLNENYARELMELHTLGVDGGYSQQDVTELARIFTGWTFDPRDLARNNRAFKFDPRRHDMGGKNWLGKHLSGAGQVEGEMALDYLAARPATARHISYQLAQYFVQDAPPPALVNRMAKQFYESQGDIRSVLALMFASPEFMAPSAIGAKFKTPYQFVISAARAAETPVENIKPLLGVLNQLGMPLYGCQTPDGYKNTEAAWLNPDALSRRINFATALASGRLPLARADDGNGKAMGGTMKEPSASAVSPPLDSTQLLATLGVGISDATRQIVDKNPKALRAAMVLGSPDFMQH